MANTDIGWRYDARDPNRVVFFVVRGGTSRDIGDAFGYGENLWLVRDTRTRPEVAVRMGLPSCEAAIEWAKKGLTL